MTLSDSSTSAQAQGVHARQMAAGDAAPGSGSTTALTLASPEAAATATAAMTEGDSLGLLALGLVVIGAYLARR